MQIEYIHFETIDSTNTWAKQHVELFQKDHLTIVSASEQTAGRGRMKHKWISPPNQNIYATFCFWIPLGFTYLNNISQLLAISCIKILEKEGFSFRLKWPNDLVNASKKKVAGLLCETVVCGDQICVMAGMGLNVNMSQELLQEIDKPATSLFLESGKLFDITTLLKSLGERFTNDLDRFKQVGINLILDEYRSLINCKIGEKIQFQSGGVRIEGVFDSIADNGSLNLRLLDNSLHNFLSGEIT